MDLDLVRDRSLLIPAQGPAGPAIVKDKNKDLSWATEPGIGWIAISEGPCTRGLP
jgi:hypothetical protein